MPSRVSMCHHGLACHHGSVCAIMGEHVPSRVSMPSPAPCETGPLEPRPNLHPDVLRRETRRDQRRWLLRRMRSGRAAFVQPFARGMGRAPVAPCAGISRGSSLAARVILIACCPFGLHAAPLDCMLPRWGLLWVAALRIAHCLGRASASASKTSVSTISRQRATSVARDPYVVTLSLHRTGRSLPILASSGGATIHSARTSMSTSVDPRSAAAGTEPKGCGSMRLSFRPVRRSRDVRHCEYMREGAYAATAHAAVPGSVSALAPAPNRCRTGLAQVAGYRNAQTPHTPRWPYVSMLRASPVGVVPVYPNGYKS